MGILSKEFFISLARLITNRILLIMRYIHTLIVLLVSASSLMEQRVPNILAGREAKAYAYADSVMKGLSDKEMLAQFIMPMVWPKSDAQSLKSWDDMVAVKRYGGVLFQKGDPKVQLAMINHMRKRAKIPMLVSADAEWGLSMRLSHTLRYPKNIMLGAADDTALAYRYGKAVAYEMKRMGIHINFAPTIDVNNNPKNPVIGVRSFGSIPARVSALGLAFSSGLESEGVLSCAKHFPGHGNTDVDSHKGLPTINGTRTTLDAVELAPFKAYIDKGLGAVMVGHLRVPALGTGERPTSIVKGVVTGLLKQEMGFGGLVVTDGLGMEGVLTDKTLSVAVEAFKAGNHVLLASIDPAKDLQALSQALSSGKISKEEVIRRCRELLAMKWAVGAHLDEPLSPNALYEDLAPVAHKALIEQINDKAMTLVKNDDQILPIRSLPKGARVALLRYGTQSCGTLLRTMKKHYEVASFALSPNASQQEKNNVYAQLKNYDTVIVALTSDKIRPDAGMITLSKATHTILVAMTSPYVLLAFDRMIPHVKAVAIGYEMTEGAQRSMGDALWGGKGFEGKLPVDLTPIFKVGTGFKTTVIRLGEGEPESVGLSSLGLQKVDEIALEGLRKKAYPGCQVLIAKEGKIVYNKSFGTKGTAHKDSVTSETLYDLASVTKAIATTPLVMIAEDRQRLSTNEPIGKYLDYLRYSNKGGIKVSDLLHHTGGMPASILFYHTLIDPKSYVAPLITHRKKKGYPTQIARKSFARRGFRYLSSMVSKDSSALYPIRFAPKMYLHVSVKDSIRAAIRDAELSVPRKGFRYSDIDFLLLQDILEQVQQKSIDVLFAEQLAQPLGLDRLLYQPYKRFGKGEIAQGQTDNFLRHATLRGDVDDESAAMRGGVSGNAGLYGNAESLAVLLQMLLNEGTYAGAQIIRPETVRKFATARHRTSPYALGFDRHRGKGESGPVADVAPISTYGHTGFTGTCFWVDPENKIIFIFLSNRGAYKRWNSVLLELNIRPRIQEAIYDALLTPYPGLPKTGQGGTHLPFLNIEYEE